MFFFFFLNRIHLFCFCIGFDSATALLRIMFVRKQSHIFIRHPFIFGREAKNSNSTINSQAKTKKMIIIFQWFLQTRERRLRKISMANSSNCKFYVLNVFYACTQEPKQNQKKKIEYIFPNSIFYFFFIFFSSFKIGKTEFSVVSVCVCLLAIILVFVHFLRFYSLLFNSCSLTDWSICIYFKKITSQLFSMLSHSVHTYTRTWGNEIYVSQMCIEYIYMYMVYRRVSY